MPLVEGIVVAEPEVEPSTPLGSHATYRITSTILFDSHGIENCRREMVTVRRRYKEFVMLQDCLRANNPVNPSPELVESRIVLLQRYLNNLLAREILSSDPSFWLFIQSEKFIEMVKEFNLLEPPTSSIPNVKLITRDPPYFHDPLEMRLEHLLKITNRMDILKFTLSEFFTSQKNLADRIMDVGRSLTGYLDANIDSGKHTKIVQILNELDNISQLLAIGTDQVHDPSSFIIILDDYIRMMAEVEQAFILKRSWRSIVYSLDLQLIDTQASLLKAQNDQNRNFDKSYSLSETYLKTKEASGEAKESYEKICRKLTVELDRIDLKRMIEIEQCINTLLRNLLQVHKEVIMGWETFLSINQSVLSFASGSDHHHPVYM